MTVEAAFQFIKLLRQAPEMRSHLKQRLERLTLDDIVSEGMKQHLEFTQDELAEAFKHDWNMKRLRYSRKGA